MTRVAQAGDPVLFVGPDRKVKLLRLQPGKRWETHHGIILHDDLIGQPLGRVVYTHKGYPYLVLEPSTADFIQYLKRRTQIIFPKDAAYIVQRLNLHAGVRVIEAGTGSGGLTLAFARAVLPGGHVYTYEERAEHQALARRNLQMVGIEEGITWHVQDIAEGFREEGVDALFLDVRTPWAYLEQVQQALRPGGFFGALVPTTNQVSQLLEGLYAQGFVLVTVEELLLRAYKPVAARLRPEDRMVAHTGYLIFARTAVGEIGPWAAPHLRKVAQRRQAEEEGTPPRPRGGERDDERAQEGG